MKKLFKAIVFATAIAGSNLFPVCNANAQGPIINIPDINFKYYVLFNFDTNSDGDIDSTEAANVTSSIDVYSFGIADLTGIEAFTAITYLDCSSNTITGLDVSANTALTYLDCSQNQLTSLDVSANTALSYLNCSINALTSLDVSANTSLTDLRCGGNLITSLDVSANLALAELVCHNNQLTGLNVKNGNNTNFIYFFAQNNPDLFCIQVDDPVFSDTASNWYKDISAYYSSNCPLGIGDFAFDNKIPIYPNPNNGEFTINVLSGNGTLAIFNSLGERIFSQPINRKQEKVNCNQISRGIYFLNVFDGKESYCKKLIFE